MSSDSIPDLLNAISVVDEAMARIDAALQGNPSTADERSLNRAKLRLAAQRAVLDSQLDDALAGTASVGGPSPRQVAEIAKLLDQTEQAHNADVSASAALALAARILTIASSALAP
jgi:hypothetical protein